MRILDLYSCAGGVAVGYARAGFRVFGVDKVVQPYYPFLYTVADVLEYLDTEARFIRRNFQAVHASPPCQRDCAITKGTNARLRAGYPDLYGPTKVRLEALGLPYVIENPAARADVVLCGLMFGLGVLRHRKFELGGWEMEQPAHVAHRGRVRGWRHGVYYDGPYIAAYGKGGGKGTLEECQEALGIDWVKDRATIVEMLPPAFGQAIGEGLMRHLNGTK